MPIVNNIMPSNLGQWVAPKPHPGETLPTSAGRKNTLSGRARPEWARTPPAARSRDTHVRPRAGCRRASPGGTVRDYVESSVTTIPGRARKCSGKCSGKCRRCSFCYRVRASRSARRRVKRAGSASSPPSASSAIPYNSSAVSASTLSSPPRSCASRNPVTRG